MPEIRKTEVEFEGRVEERETIVESEGVLPWGDDARLTEVGRPVPRVAGKARVTGQALYTVDVDFPGQLVARVLRSPHPHARVTAVDAPSLEALPGVHLIWHRDQPPPVSMFKGRELFPAEVAYEGAEVALVVARDERGAEDALRAIEVSYEPLPFVTGLESALSKGAQEALCGTGGNVINPEGRTYLRGNLERGWERAAVSVDLSFETPNASHSPLEPHAVVARWEGEQLTVWESTQGVFSVRQDVAEALGIAQDRVRVVCDFVGGGFGAKQRAGRHTLLAALASRETGRPVGLRLRRREEHVARRYRPASMPQRGCV